MAIPIVLVILSMIILQADYIPVVKADLQYKTPPTPSTTLYQIRSSDENHENQSPRIQSLNQDIWSSAGYHTLSPSPYDDDGLSPGKPGESPENIGHIGIYPELTTTVPQQPFISNNDYVGIHYPYRNNGNPQDMDNLNDDRPLKYPTNNEILGKTRNRYVNRFGDVKLKTLRPNSDDYDKCRHLHDHGHYHLHDHGYHRGNGAHNDGDDESYGNSHGAEFDDGGSNAESGSDIVYSKPTIHGSSFENSRRPANTGKSTIDNMYPDVTTGVKTIVANMHMFKFIPVLLLLAIKLKLLALFKSVMVAKLIVFLKMVKLMMLPSSAFTGMLMMNMVRSMLAKSNCTIKNDGNKNNTTTMKPQTQYRYQLSAYENGSTLLPTIPSFPAPDRNDTTTVFDTTGLGQLVESIQSEPCVERMACLASVSGSTADLESFWMNGLLPPLVDYIPNEKLHLYISTYKNVSDSRLQSTLNDPSSTDEWSKWCDGRYSCIEETTNDNLI